MMINAVRRNYVQFKGYLGINHTSATADQFGRSIDRLLRQRSEHKKVDSFFGSDERSCPLGCLQAVNGCTTKNTTKKGPQRWLREIDMFPEPTDDRR